MGNSSSKHKHQGHSLKSTPADNIPKSPKKSRLVASSPLSKRQTPSRPTPVTNTKPKSATTSESRPLGSSDSSNNGIGQNSGGVSQSAKEALARAAEERFKKLQEQKMGQKERLRSKAKTSRVEKGL